jgi:protein-L-isoaspartate(D-aspartate) O-methyltransferase
LTEDSTNKAEIMVQSQIRGRGIRDSKVLDAMSRIPRHRFVQARESSDAYGDYPLSIGFGQTISQPYMVAYMTEKLDLQGSEKVLEIGTGSGYQTAVLAELCREVYTIERIPALLRRAKILLQSMGYRNIHYRADDGSLGWEEEAPFDRILVTAAVPETPSCYKHQLADGGLIVVPVGDYRGYQILKIIRRRGEQFHSLDTIGCRFVPLLGQQGF